MSMTLCLHAPRLDCINPKTLNPVPATCPTRLDQYLHPITPHPLPASWQVTKGGGPKGVRAMGGGGGWDGGLEEVFEGGESG